MRAAALSLLGPPGGRLPTGARFNLPSGKAWGLLACLALAQGRPQSRDKLTALLWGRRPEDKARQSFRQALAGLRRALGDGAAAALQADGGTIVLDVSLVEVDVLAFRRLASGDDPEGLSRAVELYRGDLLEGLRVDEPPFEEWLVAERERLHELALEALARLLALQMKAGRIDEAIATALRSLAVDQLQEPVHRALMRCYIRQGRPSAALQQYQACVEILSRELGVEPEMETRRLHQEIAHRPTDDGAGADHPMIAHGMLAADLPIMVGRERELRDLSGTLEVASAGRGRTLVIMGESGVGKTRLVQEIAAGARAAGVRCLFAAFYRTEQALPLSGWAHLLRASAIATDDGHAGWLEGDRRAELARLLPELGAPPRRQPGKPEEYLRLFQVITDVIVRLATEQPLLLVMEDLHWADVSSLRLLAFLARRARHLPVLVLGTAREEEFPFAPELPLVIEELTRDGLGAAFALGPLSEASTQHLVGLLAAPAVDWASRVRLSDDVWRRSEGNPFVIRELIRGWSASAAGSARHDPRWPRSVEAVIRNRLDRLAPRSKELAAVAAVLGRQFDADLLKQASGLAETETSEGLEELVRHRLLEAIDDEFRFVHERVREVVHGGLLRPRRALLHARAAAALETLHDGRLEEVADRLAHHWGEAGDYGRAVQALLRLAEAAAQRYAMDQAKTVLQVALDHARRLEATPRDRHMADVTLRLVEVEVYTGHLRDAVARLIAEQHRFDRLGDDRLTARLNFWLGHAYNYLDEPGLALDRGMRALRHAERCGDRAAMGRAHYVCSRACYRRADIDLGLAHAREAITLLQQTDDSTWVGHAHWVLGLNLGSEGNYAEALVEVTRARDLAEVAGDVRLQAAAEWSRSWSHLAMSDSAAAVAACRRAVDLAPDPIHRAAALTYLGAACMEDGQAASAIETLEQALGLYGAMDGFAYMQCYAGLNFATASSMMGNHARARDVAERAFEHGRVADWKLGQGRSRRALGLAHRGLGNHQEAETQLRAAIRVLSEARLRVEEKVTQLHLADFLLERGSRPEALELLSDAITGFRALGLDRFVARAEQMRTSADPT